VPPNEWVENKFKSRERISSFIEIRKVWWQEMHMVVVKFARPWVAKE